MRKLVIAVVVMVTVVAGLTFAPAQIRRRPAAVRTRIAVIPADRHDGAVLGAAAGEADGAQTPFLLTHLAVKWAGDPAADIVVRWMTARGWGPWQPVTADHDMDQGSDGVAYSSLLRADGASRVEARVVRGDARDVGVVVIDAGSGGDGGSAPVTGPGIVAAAAAETTGGAMAAAAATTTSTSAVPLPTTTTTVPPQTTSKVAQPPIVTRAQWGADESIRQGTPEFAPITKLIVHHTDTENNDPDPASTVRAIYAYHVQTRGWNDIGYNFLIDESGRIYEGRYARTYAAGEAPTGEDVYGNGVIGAHALNANTGSVGVALLGTFDAQQPTAAALSALESLLAWKADRHHIDPEGATPYRMGDGTTKTFGNISGHRDTSDTDCPGDKTYDLLPVIRQAVDSRVGSAYGTTRGYWVAARDGQVAAFGQAVSYGSMVGHPLNSPLAGMAATVSGKGYWLLGGDGGIFAFGDAQFFGSTGGIKLVRPVVALEPTPTGKGYWLVASDGGIFAFGDAGFFGSTGGMRLNKPVVGMAATPTGKGYWLVASDGGIFAFGDATFHGSTGSLQLNSPVVAMAGSSRPGSGYWLVARDGGIFAFDVPFHGSVPGLRLSSYAGSVDIQPTGSGNGYYVLGADAGIFTFGDANFLGAGGFTGGAAAAAMAKLSDAA